jgi:hypothetical protein
MNISIIAATIFSYVFLDNNFLMRKWNIPADPPGFLDSRQFAWASESYAQGYDPLVDNPVNPKGQPLNYPRIWHLLFSLGINESHTNIMGSIIVILFFIGTGIFWYSRTFNNLTYLLLSALILSPAVMLGIERSNIELVIFFLLSLAVTVIYYSGISALILFLFAAVLKLYPVFGFLYLLKENQKRFWILLFVSSGIFILYAVLSFRDFLLVYETTPKLVGSSFGINVWWMGLRNSRYFNLPVTESMSLILKALSYIIALLILGATLFFGTRRRDERLLAEAQYIDAFRVGAGIYIGCFLLMNTHDYRFIFLVFAVPQLTEWLWNKGKNISRISLITVLAMIFSVWSFFVMRFLGRRLTFAAEELCNWIILAGLLYLLFSSFPEWLRNYLRIPFSHGLLSRE